MPDHDLRQDGGRDLPAAAISHGGRAPGGPATRSTHGSTRSARPATIATRRDRGLERECAGPGGRLGPARMLARCSWLRASNVADSSSRPPLQVPFEPGAGFVADVTDEEHQRWLESLDRPTKPDHTGDRMAACLGMPGLTDRERKLLALVAYFDGDGGAWPSQARLAEMAAIPRPTVNEVLHKLRAKGRLRWRRRHGSERATNVYEVAYLKPFQCQDLPDTGEQVPMSGFGGRECQDSPDTNLEPGRASREVTKGTIDRSPDLCRGRRGECERGRFVGPGAECLRCGWRRPG